MAASEEFIEELSDGPVDGVDVRCCFGYSSCDDGDDDDDDEPRWNIFRNMAASTNTNVRRYT
jgi:hypothetical protein